MPAGDRLVKERLLAKPDGHLHVSDLCSRLVRQPRAPRVLPVAADHLQIDQQSHDEVLEKVRQDSGRRLQPDDQYPFQKRNRSPITILIFLFTVILVVCFTAHRNDDQHVQSELSEGRRGH